MNMKRFELELNGEKIPLKKIEDFSFREMSDIKNILQGDLHPYDKQKYLLHIFTGLSLEIISKFKNLYIINFTEIFNESNKKIKIETNLNEHNLQDLNKISIGKFIDMEYFLQEKDFKMEKIVALMYLTNDYDEELLKLTKNEVLDKIPALMGSKILEIFINFRKNFYKLYEGLFEQINESEDDEDKDEEEETTKEEENDTISWGLMEYVYHLADGNILRLDEITKKSLFEVFNYLSWQKEQNDKMLEKQKRKINNI